MSTAAMARSGSQGQATVHVVGGGVPGLMTAIDITVMGRALGLPLVVRVYEGGAFGGGADDRVAASRCQLWLHTHGQLYALGQPAVCRALQLSTQRLQRLAPLAFSYPPALVIEPPTVNRSSLAAFYHAARVPYRQISSQVVRHWYPSFQIGPKHQFYDVADAVMDLTVLAHSLALLARRLGVTLVQQQIGRLVYSWRVKVGRIREDSIYCHSG